MAPFDIKEVRDMMMDDELELDKLGDRKTALFCIVSDTDTTFNFIASMVYTQMFNVLCDRALENGGALKTHVTCLLDEFANQKIPNFTRSSRLGDDYTKEALRERITGTRQGQKTAATKRRDPGRNVNLLVDIQAKMQAGKGKGYERWAKVFNLKEAAKTLNFLVENGVTDYSELEARAGAAGEAFDSLSARIKQLEGRMAEVAQLKTHIINYSKTREVYKEYRKSRNKKSYRVEHADEIRKHEAAKAAFDALGGKAIPKVAQLSSEYAALLAEKKERYEEYKAARKDMIDYQTAKQNVDRILGLEPMENVQQKKQDTER